MTRDIIIVGAGPGGYLIAERAGRCGKKVLLPFPAVGELIRDTMFQF